jgi:hypothetical protein
MKIRASYVGWLLPLFLTACFPFHKEQKQSLQQFAPPVANLPKPPVDHPELPVTEVTIPSEPLDTDTDEILEEAAKSPARHRRPASKPAQEAADTPAEADTPGVSAVGQLSSPEPSDMRIETDASIAATERGLNGLGRNLSGPERKIAAQIREYLKQAREALLNGDVDGARTLAAKAKVLLGELNQ